MMRHVASNALTLLIVGLVVLFGIVTWGKAKFRAPGPLTAPAVIEVDKGDVVAVVAKKLVDVGAIDDPRVFRIGARYSGMDAGLKFGEYRIPAGASMQQILALLTEGGNVVHQIVVPEGWSNAQVADMLNGHDELTGEITDLPPEGSLAPAGYDYQRGDERQGLIDRMKETQDKILAQAWAGRAPDLPVRSPLELLTLASIVEKETALPEERPEVAAVFVNRLRIGMKLQTDPTVIYGITKGKASLGRGLKASELTQATPYNTYAAQGLPPTPIANPGKAAIEAAAHPAVSDALYFVANGTGGHAFAATLVQHNMNVAAWRKIHAQQAAEEKAAGEAPPDAATEPAPDAATEPAPDSLAPAFNPNAPVIGQ